MPLLLNPMVIHAEAMVFLATRIHFLDIEKPLSHAHCLAKFPTYSSDMESTDSTGGYDSEFLSQSIAEPGEKKKKKKKKQ